MAALKALILSLFLSTVSSRGLISGRERRGHKSLSTLHGSAPRGAKNDDARRLVDIEWYDDQFNTTAGEILLLSDFLRRHNDWTSSSGDDAMGMGMGSGMGSRMSSMGMGDGGMSSSPSKELPSYKATSRPIKSPILPAPIVQPSDPPTVTTSPKETPSVTPTNPPTSSPVVVTTNPSTPAPVILPTNPPTAAPILVPTSSPTPLPVLVPTNPPTPAPVILPTNPPTPVPVITPTDLPTIDAFTSQPTFEPCPVVPDGGCSICGDGRCLSNPDGVFSFPGQPSVSCGELQSGGFDGLIDLQNCLLLPGLIESSCECRDSAGIVPSPVGLAPTSVPPAGTLPPTVAPTLPPTVAPTLPPMVELTLLPMVEPTLPPMVELTLPPTPEPTMAAVTPDPVASPSATDRTPSPTVSGCRLNVPDTGCSVCGPDSCITLPEALFEFPNQPTVRCDLLQEAGYEGAIPLDQCPFLPGLISSLCGCEFVVTRAAAINSQFPPEASPISSPAMISPAGDSPIVASAPSFETG